MGIVTWAVVGALRGPVRPSAEAGAPGASGSGLTVVIGIAGSLIGGFVATTWLDIADFDEFDFGSFLIAVGASVLLLAIYERVDRLLPDRKRERKDE